MVVYGGLDGSCVGRKARAQWQVDETYDRNREYRGQGCGKQNC